MFKTSMAISPAPAKFAPLLFAGEWGHGLETAAELGYDAVELSLRDPDRQLLEAMERDIRGKGLAVSAIATGQSYLSDGLSLSSADPSVQNKLLDRMKRFIDFVARWNGLVILGGIRGRLLDSDIPHEAQRQQALVAIRNYAEYAKPKNVRLAVEPINRYETNFVNTIGEALGVIGEVDAQNLVVLADSFHMNIEEASMTDSVGSAASRLGYVHFADSNRLAPGQGHIDFRGILTALRRIGFQGYIGAEILPLPDSAKAARSAIEFLRLIQK